MLRFGKQEDDSVEESLASLFSPEEVIKFEFGLG